MASLDQSLQRLGLEYVDIFYSHRFDPDTPLEETMGALAHAVRSGKALYVGISSYPEAQTRQAHRILKEMGVATTIHQPSYSMLNRWVEEGLLDTLHELGVGCIAFSPLAQGMLTAKYLDGRPADSRAAKGGSLTPDLLTPETLQRIRVPERYGVDTSQWKDAERNMQRHAAELAESEERLRLAALRLGRETMIKMFGWDPEDRGW